MSNVFQVKDLRDWERVASYLVQQLQGGQMLTLSGPLGAGKTTLVQALAHELGIKAEPRSPTFSLLRSYRLPEARQGIQRLVHVDAYRLEQASDVHALDLESELAEQGTLIVIEWPERISEALTRFQVPTSQVEIQPLPTGEREVRITLER